MLRSAEPLHFLVWSGMLDFLLVLMPLSLTSVSMLLLSLPLLLAVLWLITLMPSALLYCTLVSMVPPLASDAVRLLISTLLSVLYTPQSMGSLLPIMGS